MTNHLPGEYVCYVLISECGRRTYAGCTNNLPRRLRQHRGFLRGGARATRAFGPGLRTMFVVCGFGKSKKNALRFEWRLKHRRGNRVGGTSPTHGRWVLLQRALAWAEGHGVPASVCSHSDDV